MRSPRPQTLLLTLFGRHVDRTDLALSSTSVLAVLDRLGVSADAGRSTVTRMVSRGYLVRHRRGRHAYYSLTRRSHQLLIEARARVMVPPTRADDARWTLLSFSIPEGQRRDRHHLRAALSWRGFGLLRSGLWIAPGRPDVRRVITDLDLEGHVEVFVGRPSWPSDIGAIVSEVWDLAGLEEGYRDFLARWAGDDAPHDARWVGPLAEQIRLLTEWAVLVRSDPFLPLRHLPVGWPGMPAYDLFVRRHGAVSDAARAEFEELRETLEVHDALADADGELELAPGADAPDGPGRRGGRR